MVLVAVSVCLLKLHRGSNSTPKIFGALCISPPPVVAEASVGTCPLSPSGPAKTPWFSFFFGANRHPVSFCPFLYYSHRSLHLLGTNIGFLFTFMQRDVCINATVNFWMLCDQIGEAARSKDKQQGTGGGGLPCGTLSWKTTFRLFVFPHLTAALLSASFSTIAGTLWVDSSATVMLRFCKLLIAFWAMLTNESIVARFGRNTDCCSGIFSFLLAQSRSFDATSRSNNLEILERSDTGR